MMWAHKPGQYALFIVDAELNEDMFIVYIDDGLCVIPVSMVLDLRVYIETTSLPTCLQWIRAGIACKRPSTGNPHHRRGSPPPSKQGMQQTQPDVHGATNQLQWRIRMKASMR